MYDSPPAMIHLSPEQRIAVHQAQTPIQALDPDTNREYVILERAAFEKMKRAADFDAVDPSLFEYDQLGTVVESPRGPVRILTRLPFSDRSSTVEFQDTVVEVKPFQIILWASVQSGNVVSRPFPAFLDTGHNETFSISSQQLLNWASVDYRKLPLLPGVRIGKYVLPRCEARLALHPNVPGERSISKRPAFPLRLRSGIIIQHPDEATRLPILGMRSLAENNLRLIVDGRRRHVSLRTGLLW